MNFKKRMIISITVSAFIVFALLVVYLKGSLNKPADLPKNPDSESVSETFYGGIQTSFSNFKITPEFQFQDYPTIFSKDGKVGYKDKDGKIIVQPIYAVAHEYWNGVGSVRIDNYDGPFTWKAVDVYGNF